MSEYKEGRGDYYLAEGKREEGAAMTPPREPRTASGRAFVYGLPFDPDSEEHRGYVRAVVAIEDEAEAAGAPLREAVDDALQYALAFLNDPEGLASAREEWRDKVRDALTASRAALAARAAATEDTDAR